LPPWFVAESNESWTLLPSAEKTSDSIFGAKGGAFEGLTVKGYNLLTYDDDPEMDFAWNRKQPVARAWI
jgi:hypothetical protein